MIRPRTPSSVDEFFLRNRVAVVSIGLMSFAILLVCLPVVAYVTTQDVDYAIHQDLIAKLVNGGSLADFLTYVPHFFYHLLIIGLYGILPGLGIHGAMIVVTLAFYVAAGMVIWGLCGYMLGRPITYRGGFFYSVTAIALLLVSAITLFTPDNRYLGYIVIHTYHNPTIVALQPLALLTFALTLRVFSSQPFAHPRLYGLLLLSVSVCCILAKPNYMMAFLPALVIVIGVMWLRRQPVRWLMLIGCVVLPCGMILLAQSLYFRSDTNGLGIVPFQVFYAWDRILNPLASANLLLKFLLSIAFPLCVYLCFFRAASRNFALNFAWLVFGVGVFFMYFIGEVPHVEYGNFTWGAHITLLVLFVYSTIFLIQQLRESQTRLSRVLAGLCTVIFVLHLVSGIAWYQFYTGGLTMNTIIYDVW